MDRTLRFYHQGESQMSTVITGLFKTPGDAARAVHAVEARGIPADRISVIANDKLDKDAFGVDTHSKLPEGVAIGAGAGGAVGALVAGFTAVGTIVTGGAGLLIAGPLAAALAGAGAGAAGGGILGGLVGVAIPEHEVKHYEDALERGSVLVGVEYETSDQKKVVQDTFDECDAEKVSSA
ncbi:hypothetical protein ACERK3_10885 [Phycisphaerales bacterium AB-hyl4]|uniref:Heat induced stress protein YflT n=1 Tax=Natronomicrosphaera hydrolytica TaxID=3242702 RepID=A0ABV4U5D4_9BACT